MVDAQRIWSAVPQPIRRFPADLGAVVILVVLTCLSATAPVVRDTPLVFVLGFPFVLFLPGYAVMAVVYPEGDGVRTGDGEGNDAVSEPDRGIGGIERAVFSFGLSMVFVPFVGVALVLLGIDLSSIPVLLAVGGFTVVTTVVAAVRRWRLPQEERLRVPLKEWYAASRASGSDAGRWRGDSLNIVVALSLLLALGSVGYAVAVHEQDEPFTEFYLATENETGALTANDYPTNFTEGEGESMVVGISNHEGRHVNYSGVVLLERVADRNGSPEVVETQRLNGFEIGVEANSTVHYRHEIRPEMTGERLRLQFLLYRGAPPRNPTAEDAYRRTTLWVNVTSSDSVQSWEVAD